MAGLMVFKTLADALRAGYQVYDRTADGYLVRTRTSAGWAIALVVLLGIPWALAVIRLLDSKAGPAEE